MGPLLFLAYVNDVTDILPSHCTSKLFADNLKLYSVAHTFEDNALIIQKRLEKLYHWSPPMRTGVIPCYQNLQESSPTVRPTCRKRRLLGHRLHLAGRLFAVSCDP